MAQALGGSWWRDNDDYPPRLPRSGRLWAGDAFPAGHKLHSRRASLRSYHPDTIRSRGSRRRTGACGLKEHPSPPAATVLGRLRPGPTSPGWPLLSARSVWLFWAGCVPPSGCRDCFASSSPRSSTSAQYEARGLPSLLCASTDTGRWRRWRPFASSSPRRQLQQQAQLRSKHVGFFNLCVRALA